MEEAEFRSIVEPLGRRLEQRTTLYGRTRTDPAPGPGPRLTQPVNSDAVLTRVSYPP
jgi:hypothetical protein